MEIFRVQKGMSGWTKFPGFSDTHDRGAEEGGDQKKQHGCPTDMDEYENDGPFFDKGIQRLLEIYVKVIFNQLRVASRNDYLIWTSLRGTSTMRHRARHTLGCALLCSALLPGALHAIVEDGIDETVTGAKELKRFVIQRELDRIGPFALVFSILRNPARVRERSWNSLKMLPIPFVSKAVWSARI